MALQIIKTGLQDIQDLRVQFLAENNFQFIFNKCHEYGWADTWLFRLDGEKIGYGAIWGTESREDRDAIFEFYLAEPFVKFATMVFAEFYPVSGATLINCQSNDALVCSMLFEFAQDINAESILFEDHFQTKLAIPAAVFSREPGAATGGSDAGGYFLKQNGEVVATGGFMLNYNKPYADIYMEVKEPFRQKGFGSLIVQELKREIYLLGMVPAARCNISNRASKATLLKAGFKVCGAILTGNIKGENINII